MYNGVKQNSFMSCIIILDLLTDEDLEQYLKQNPSTKSTFAGQDIYPINIQDTSYNQNPPGY